MPAFPKLTKHGPTAYCIAGRHDLCARVATRPCPCACGHDPDAELEQLYRAGMTSTQLKQRFGIATSTVSRRLQKRRVPMRPPGSRTRARLPADDITRRYRHGESTHKLAAAYKVSVNTICRLLRDEGVTLRPANRHRVHQRPKPGQRTCSTPGCDDAYVARGLCRYHYDLRRREHRDAP